MKFKMRSEEALVGLRGLPSSLVCAAANTLQVDHHANRKRLRPEFYKTLLSFPLSGNLQLATLGSKRVEIKFREASAQGGATKSSQVDILQAPALQRSIVFPRARRANSSEKDIYLYCSSLADRYQVERARCLIFSFRENL